MKLTADLLHHYKSREQKIKLSHERIGRVELAYYDFPAELSGTDASSVHITSSTSNTSSIGPPLVLLPSFPIFKEEYLPLIERLRVISKGKLSRRVLAVDFPFWLGNSNADEIPTLPELAEIGLDWLDQLGVTRCDLLGYSVGGLVALQMKEKSLGENPDLVSDLFLVSTPADVKEVLSKHQNLVSLYELLRWVIPQNLLTRIFISTLASSVTDKSYYEENKEVFDYLYADLQRLNTKNALESLLLARKYASASLDLPKTTKINLLLAEADPDWVFSAVEQFKSQYTIKSQKVIPAADHNHVFVHPEIVAEFLH